MDKTNNKIEILKYINSIGSTPLKTIKHKTGITKPRTSVRYIKPIYPHEQIMINNPPITLELLNRGNIIPTKYCTLELPQIFQK